MANKQFEVIRDTDSTVLIQVTANTEFGGATVEFFDTWQDPAHLDKFSAVIAQAAQWLRDQGV